MTLEQKEVDAAIERLKRFATGSTYTIGNVPIVKYLDLLSRTITEQEQEIAALRAEVETRDKAIPEMVERQVDLHGKCSICPFKHNEKCWDIECPDIDGIIAATLEAVKERTV